MKQTSILNKCQQDIKKNKNRLMKKKMSENFGQEEIRYLRDKYNPHIMNDLMPHEIECMLNQIDEFEEWCATKEV